MIWGFNFRKEFKPAEAEKVELINSVFTIALLYISENQEEQQTMEDLRNHLSGSWICIFFSQIHITLLLKGLFNYSKYKNTKVFYLTESLRSSSSVKKCKSKSAQFTRNIKVRV